MLGIAVIGTGRIGTHHVQALAEEVPGARVVAVVDAAVDRARALADRFHITHAVASADDALELEEVDAVVISTPVATHRALIESAAAAGRHIFTEKPIAATVADARAAAVAAESAGVTFQIGFNRRFAESWVRAHRLVAEGRIGNIHRFHSITRDPGPYRGAPSRTPLNTIFNETLIHDFDTIGWFMGDASPASVYAAADALIAPEAKADGFLDSAVVTIRYDNGAVATAEASFSALYGYDVRGEVFGSGGMAQMGQLPSTEARLFTADGMSAPTDGIDTVRLHDAYVAEFEAFVRAVNGERDTNRPTGADGIAAQAIAAGAALSHQEQRSIEFSEVAVELPDAPVEFSEAV